MATSTFQQMLTNAAKTGTSTTTTPTTTTTVPATTTTTPTTTGTSTGTTTGTGTTTTATTPAATTTSANTSYIGSMAPSVASTATAPGVAQTTVPTVYTQSATNYGVSAPSMWASGAMTATPSAPTTLTNAQAADIIKQYPNTFLGKLEGIAAVGKAGQAAAAGVSPSQLQKTGFDVQAQGTPQAVSQAVQQSAYLTDIAGQLMNDVTSGKVDPAIQSAIDYQVNDQINQLTQQFLSMGIGTNNTQYAQAVAQIKAGGANAVAQAMQQKYANALQAFGLDQTILNYITGINSSIYAGMAQQINANTQAAAAKRASTNQLIGDVAMLAATAFFNI